MSTDQTSHHLQYNAYKSKFGHPPKSATHLINFAKKNGVSLNWKQASLILKNAPTQKSSAYKTNPNLSINTSINALSKKSTQSNNTKKQHKPLWKLHTKIDPITGKQVISSRGIPPPPGQSDIYQSKRSQPFETIKIATTTRECVRMDTFVNAI